MYTNSHTLSHIGSYLVLILFSVSCTYSTASLRSHSCLCFENTFAVALLHWPTDTQTRTSRAIFFVRPLFFIHDLSSKLVSRSPILILSTHPYRSPTLRLSDPLILLQVTLVLNGSKNEVSRASVDPRVRTE